MLEEFRKRYKGWEQKSLAEAFGISPQYMNDIWRGRRPIPIKVLKHESDGRGLYVAQARERALIEWEMR